MQRVWDQWHGYLFLATGVCLPVLALTLGILVKKRGQWRTPLLDVGMVGGTVPWLWMAFTPVTVPPGTRFSYVVPFSDIISLITNSPGFAFAQITANMLVLAALGALAPLRFAALANGWRLLGLGVAISLGIEILQQLLVGGRVFSVDDVILNGGGCALFGLITRAWWTKKHLPEHTHNAILHPEGNEFCVERSVAERAA